MPTPYFFISIMFIDKIPFVIALPSKEQKVPLKYSGKHVKIEIFIYYLYVFLIVLAYFCGNIAVCMATIVSVITLTTISKLVPLITKEYP